MSNLYSAVFSDLDLNGKIILDAATGAGESTCAWAAHLSENRFESKIISVDIEQPPRHVARLKEKLGPLQKYVEFRQADIFNLEFLKNDSVDVVNCDDTMVFLNPVPLKLMSAFREFHRVIKPGGQLIMVSEVPVDNTPEKAGQWRRWNLAKAVRALQGEIWAAEPLIPEVMNALELLGFSYFRQHHFPGWRIAGYQPVMDEWQEVLTEKINQLAWPYLKPALLTQVARVMKQVSQDGYLMSPDIYILKCTKQKTTEN